MGAYESNGYNMSVNPYWENKDKSGGGGSADSAKKSDIATEFKTTTSYTAGCYVYHNDKLYIFNVDHAAGAWDPADVSEANVTDEITSNKAAIDELDGKVVANPTGQTTDTLAALEVDGTKYAVGGGGGGATVLPVSTDTNTLQKVLKYMIDNGKKLAFIPSMAFELKESTGPKITCGRISDTALSGDNGTIAFKDGSGTKYAIKMILDGAEIFFESVYVHITYYEDGTCGYQLSFRRATLKQVGNGGSLKIVKDSDGSNVNTFTFGNMNTFFGTLASPNNTLFDYLFSGIDISDCIKAIYGSISYDGTTVGTDRLGIFGNREVAYVDIINKILFKGSFIVDLSGSGISYPTSQAFATGANVTDSTFSSSTELNRVASDAIEVYEENENIILF